MSQQQHEGFDRPKIAESDIAAILCMVEGQAWNHLRQYGDGIFMHPQEIVGCMYGQVNKLSAAADATLYDGNLSDFRERCRKTLWAAVIALVSTDRMTQIRHDQPPGS